MSSHLRIQQLLDALPPGKPLVDVGCDHGWLPILAIHQDRAPHAIGVDLHEEPLQGARRHAARLGLGDDARLEFRLGDGLDMLREGDPIHTLVIAGLGSRSHRAILRPWSRLAALGFQHLILQAPRSELQLRAELLGPARQQGWQIVGELLMREQAEIYRSFVLGPGPRAAPVEDRADLLLGEHLLQIPDRDLLEDYLRTMRHRLRRSLRRCEEQGAPEPIRAGYLRDVTLLDRALDECSSRAT